MKEVNGVKYYVVCVEGIDCVGKKTFVKNLTDMIREKTRSNPSIGVLDIDFPAYTLHPTGPQIKEMLQSENVDEIKLNELMHQNRLDKFEQVYESVGIAKSIDKSGKLETIILILDRGFISAFNYTLAGAIIKGNKKELFDKILEEFDNDAMKNGISAVADICCRIGNDAMWAYTNIFREVYKFPTIDILVQMNRDLADSRSTGAHLAVMDARAEALGNDSHENDDMQEVVSKCYYFFRNFYESMTSSKFTKSDVFIPFGENFGNTIYEEKIVGMIEDMVGTERKESCSEDIPEKECLRK